MSEIATSDIASAESEKPVVTADDVKLPPFPDPTDNDFDEDISDEEKSHYKARFPDLNNVVSIRLHCTACDRHLGCSASNESRMRTHPMLRTLICVTCHSFYNSGEFDKGEDGSELYCRWCGQGGQVYCCSDCIHVFCAKCIKRNLGLPKIKEIENTDDWKCFKCNPKCLWDLRAVCWALLRYCDLRNKLVFKTDDLELRQKYAKAIAIDLTECCKNKAKRSQKTDSAKKKEKDAESVTKKIISKIPPTIQVKKFASVNLDEIKPKLEKKPQKRPASPKSSKAVMIKNPITIAPYPIGTPVPKKFRDNSSNMNDLELSMIPEVIKSHNKRGRPKGSKNKIRFNKTQRLEVINKLLLRYNVNAAKAQQNNINSITNKRGRPKGSRNKVWVDELVLGPENTLEQNRRSQKNSPIKRKRGRLVKKKKTGRPKASQQARKEQVRTSVAQYQRKLIDAKEETKTEIKFMIQTPNLFSPVRYPNEKKINLTRVQRPRFLGPNNFNGFNSSGVYMNNMNNLNMNLVNDNINLSLDSLTQGLDFAAVQAINNTNSTFQNNDAVVCTPDFPMEPLCEVTEDNDDDVECITPGPVAAPKVSNPPPLVPVRTMPISSIPKGNVIQMTESDVTVNALTGGLKFRVDPQTLSSNKMYRLPDGRIFAINANPNMPGGYSATIVSQNPDGSPKVTPRSETFAAKLSAVSHSPKARRGGRSAGVQRRKNSPKPKTPKTKEPKDTPRTTDLKVPVEWYRYNMIDAVDALEYSLSRLHKLKKETTSAHLRTRTVDEMKYLHRKLEQLLTTSSKRFIEIRDTLNKEMKVYISHKENGGCSSVEEDDDDVEILPNAENDDPIFIDENSDSENQEVDLTGAASSEHNDSSENRLAPDQDRDNHINDDSNGASTLIDFGASNIDTSKTDGTEDSENAKEHLLDTQDDTDKTETDESPEKVDVKSDLKQNELNGEDDKTDDEEIVKHEVADETEGQENDIREVVEKQNNDTPNTDEDETSNTKELSEEKADHNHDNEKDQDGDMSEEMIETLLKDDNLDGNASMEMSDLQEAEEILS